MNDDALIQETIEYLKRMRLITTQKIKFSRVSRSRYAYVINDLDYAKNTSIIYDYFSGIGIELCGRFAEFKYLNMDATIGSAIQTAKRLMKDA
jgi:protoporphyrinogen oxidase